MTQEQQKDMAEMEDYCGQHGWVEPLTQEDQDYYAYFRNVCRRYNINPSKANRLEYDFVIRVAESEFYVQKATAFYSHEDSLTDKKEGVARNRIELFDQEDAVRRSTKAQVGQARKEGLKEGRTEGEARLLQLISGLYSAGRENEVERAVNDEAYRVELYKEFGLTIE